MPTPPAIRLQTNTLQSSFSLKRRIASDLGEVDPMVAEIVLDDVHHFEVLGEDDDFLAAGERLLDQFLEDLELPGMEIHRARTLDDQRGMVADALELRERREHRDV